MIDEASFNGRYILDGHTAVPEPDLLLWGRWFEEHCKERIVKQENVGDVWISTVFLALDHGFFFSTTKYVPPVLFETMVFPRDRLRWLLRCLRFLGVRWRMRRKESMRELALARCSTWDEAEAQHAAMVERFKTS